MPNAQSPGPECHIGVGRASLPNRGLRENLVPPATVESVRDTKGWLSAQMVDRRHMYSPAIDQAALAETFDFELADRRRRGHVRRKTRSARAARIEGGPMGLFGVMATSAA